MARRASRSRRLPSALGLAVALAACSAPSVAFDELDQALQQARCERLVRCGLFADEASCARYAWVVSSVDLAGAVAAHKVDYDGARAKDCVDATAEQSCDLSAPDARATAAGCAQMLAGRIADGEACSIDVECRSGVCTLPIDCPEVGCCVGACRTTQAAGGPASACDQPRDCAAGLVCGRARACLAPAGAGEDCGSDRECADGLGCINPLTTMLGTCRALPHAGEDCPYLRCADEGLRCDEATHRCVALGLPGAPCGGPDECSPYLTCDATAHSCRELPTLGMPCDTGCGGVAYCARGGRPTGTCSAPQASGAPCAAYNECASFYCQPGPVFDSCQDPPACF
jgi:hypothetical protein